MFLDFKIRLEGPQGNPRLLQALRRDCDVPILPRASQASGQERGVLLKLPERQLREGTILKGTRQCPRGCYPQEIRVESFSVIAGIKK